jgi:hypothetical protein
MAGLRPGQIEKILRDNIGDINKAFRKEIKAINIVALILDLINKGISPVMGAAARFKKYSDSYIDVIKGKAKYISYKSGKVVRIEPKMTAGASTSFKIVGKGEDKGKVIPGKQKKAKYEVFEKGLGVGKKVSPVNLKVSGEMQKTLSFNDKTGELLADHERWTFHNDGTSKIPERRLLPNRIGERFNRRIDQKITEALLKALKLDSKSASKVKRFASVKFIIR